ncbi:A118 family predicted phage portal protein [Haloactinopolyspora alba]|uniref:A118 family predicted phage portal protein n=1 Tax=Haloactinopolyspora alba TaxID=648780 RepID=A0A2P8DEZ3_9ACTN|nr:phage portal protein [Haloactinopolyspora alba]PSK95781.1 A118 family predicted phage portal protein [Haloactinopolyspora alba]
MPLPIGDQQWPPRAIEPEQRLFREWGAWYSGNPDELAEVYGGNSSGGVDLKQLDRPSQHRGGVVGKVARWFWGAPLSSGQQRNPKLHVPLAGDIAETSADLLFSEPPQFHTDDKETQTRVLELADELIGMHPLLLEAGETCAAYGGVYLRGSVDETVADHPLVDVIPADVAVPEFTRGRLAAVTFWRVVAEDEKTSEVWRHLERHERGRVYHGLYKGTSDRLGTMVPLEDHPDTEAFAVLVDEQGGITTDVDGLSVVYVPNMRPNRVLRGSPLGRSDYSTLEPMLDALDETWTSWMRDLRLAKARIIVPEAYLDDLGTGKGAAFNAEREVYEALAMPPTSEGGLTLNQFKIRVEEHQSTVDALTSQIVQSAGYSMQTFGDSTETANAMTATEVRTRENKSFTTRGRKVNYWRPQLRRLWSIILQLDAARFRRAVTPEGLQIEWPDGTTDHPEVQAKTLQLITAAEAASTRTRVAMLHPDWDDTQIDAEAAKIAAESGRSVPDPITLGGAATEEE